MLLGLTGYSGSGKDSVAQVLTEHHGFQRRAFADVVRRFLELQDPNVRGYRKDSPADLAAFHGGWDEAKRIEPELRPLLQRTGMALREVFGEDVLVNAVFGGVLHKPVYYDFGPEDYDLIPDEDLVISDVRLPNEARAIKDRGGVIWRVERPGYGPVNDHESETAMDGEAVDNVIENVGGLDLLADEVAGALITASV